MQNTSGIPMDDKSLKEWQQSFKDIEEAINLLYEEDKPKKKSKVSADTNSAKVKKVNKK